MKKSKIVFTNYVKNDIMSSTLEIPIVEILKEWLIL